MAEGLRHFKFHGFVFTLWIFIGVGFAVGIELSAEGSAAALLALIEASAAWEQIAAGIRPSASVDGGEAYASRW